MIESSGPKRVEAGFHRSHVVGQPRTGTIERHPVAPNDVCLHLRPEAKAEIPTR